MLYIYIYIYIYIKNNIKIAKLKTEIKYTSILWMFVIFKENMQSYIVTELYHNKNLGVEYSSNL